MIQKEFLVLLAVLASLCYIYIKRAKTGPFSHLPLPPGPKRLPLIGNLLDMPATAQTYHRWSTEFGKWLSDDIVQGRLTRHSSSRYRHNLSGHCGVKNDRIGYCWCRLRVTGKTFGEIFQSCSTYDGEWVDGLGFCLRIHGIRFVGISCRCR